jgi:hypothetical protein
MIPGSGDEQKLATGTVAGGQAGFRRFSAIYEPSGIIQLDDNRLLIIEDEKEKPFSSLSLEKDGTATEYLVSGELSESPEDSRFAGFDVDDLEGLARDNNGYVYAISSHGRTKSDKSRPGREQLIRFRVKDNRLYDINEAGDCACQR